MGDNAARRNDSTIADDDRGYKCRIGADERIRADGRLAFHESIKVASDGASADVGFTADLRVADVGEMARLDAVMQRRAVNLDEVPNSHAFFQSALGTNVGKWSDFDVGSDDGAIRVAEENLALVAHEDIDEARIRTNARGVADSAITDEVRTWLDDRVVANLGVRADVRVVRIDDGYPIRHVPFVDLLS